MDRIILVIIVVLGLGAVQTVQAQTLPEIDRSRYSPAAYYNYAEPGDVTIHTNVWGTVRNPGLYEVPQGMRLSTLLSVAGGPMVTPRLRREDREVAIRLYREEGGTRVLIYEAVMQNNVTATTEDPVLQEGDVLTVETLVNQRFSWRDLFPIIGAVAAVALAVERFASVQ